MDRDRVAAQLERLLRSAPFATTQRLSRFLKLVVEEAAAGRADSLKEYRIGVEVFDRGKEFDPRLDPIVRVQAAKLRSKLAEYYAGEGADDPIVVTIPKGTYAPDISEKTARSSSRGPAATGPDAAGVPAPDRSSIAVLPFVNMTPDPENEYFSDGLTEELINRLTRIPGLNVVARTSAFRFKGQSLDLREVGAALNAGLVLEGSLRRFEDQVRITAQLIDVRSGYHLLSKTFQRRYENLFDLQDDLAQSVVEEVAPSGTSPAGTARRTSLEAYQAYLRGMYGLGNVFADQRPSIERFREALRIDPEFAPAWAGVAQAYWQLAWFYVLPAAEALPQSKEAALKTLALDDQSAQGHASLGLVESGFEWRWSSAEAHFRKAIALQPGLVTIYPFYAVVCLLPQGRLDEACAMVERSLVLDPFNPLFQAMATFVYAVAGRFEQALRQHALARDIAPNFPPVLASGATALEFKGDLDAAIEVYRAVSAATGDGVPMIVSLLGHALARRGKEAEARKLLRKLLALPGPPDLDVARVYSGLRDTDETLRWLEAAVGRRDVHLLGVPPDPRFAWIRGQARFRGLLRRMSLDTPAPGA